MPQYKQNTAKGVRWFCKFNYRDPNTHEIRTKLKRGFVTKRDAKLFEEGFLESLNETSSEETPGLSPTFDDVFKEWLQSYKQADLKESTLQTKMNIFEKHILPTFRDIPVSEITAEVIANWQEDMKKKITSTGKPLSNAFLHTVQSQLNTVINYSYRKNFTSLNPLVDIKNMGHKEARVDFWSPEEYQRFAYQAMNYPEYYYFYEVLYWSACRCGEALALQIQDVDLNKGEIHISKTWQKIHGREVVTSPKTECSVRTVSIPEFLVVELTEYINMLYEPSPTDRLFPITKSGASKNFKMLTEAAQLKHIPLHGLRHSAVSLMISQHYDAFEIGRRIGHRQTSTTYNIYGHLFDETQRKIANDLNTIREDGKNVGEKL